MSGSSVPRPGIGEAEVGAQVDDLEVIGQAGGQLRGLAVRKRGEQQVGVGQDVRAGAGEDGVVQAGIPGELRVRCGHGQAGAAVRGQRADLEVGMAGQQPEQFAARIAAGPRYRNPGTHKSLTSAPPTLEEYSL